MSDYFFPETFLTLSIFAQHMPVDFFPTVSRVIILGSVLAIFVAISFYVTKNIFETTKNNPRPDVSNDMLTEIRRARDDGEISEEEYQKIRTQLVSAIRKNSLEKLENIPLEEIKKE